MDKNSLMSYYGKPIEMGDEYYIVRKNNNTPIRSVLNNETFGASINNEECAARFLTKAGAEKFANRTPIKDRNKIFYSNKVQVEEPVKPKTEEELREEELSKLSLLQQLLIVENRKDFNKWLSRNKLKMNNTDSQVAIVYISNGASLISIKFEVDGVPYCCGGKEIGKHEGEVSNTLSQGITEAHQFILFKYLAEDFDKVMKEYYTNFGLVNYVVDAGKFNYASGRMGMMLNFSQYFNLVTTFTNPNTDNTVQLYAVNDNWDEGPLGDDDDDDDDY